uniref:Uncharacterized protein n=1 Tax=Trichuris muris TaxID=70415 RepID=A0A5S6Q1J1_TRIMR
MKNAYRPSDRRSADMFDRRCNVRSKYSSSVCLQFTSILECHVVLQRPTSQVIRRSECIRILSCLCIRKFACSLFNVSSAQRPTCCRLCAKHCSNRRRAVSIVHACRLPFFEPDHRLLVVTDDTPHRERDCNRRPRRQPDPHCRHKSPNGAGTGRVVASLRFIKPDVDLDMDADHAASSSSSRVLCSSKRTHHGAAAMRAHHVCRQ